MTELRLARALRAGLIAERDGHVELTGRGRRMASAFAALRRFFGHDARPKKPLSLLILARVFSVVIFAVALLWPIAWIVWHGVTLTGVNEESVGYRYFYTLRALYDPPTFLFLPQGQFTNLIQKLIQLSLTALGLPATQLRPRIDYFCYASVAAFHLMNVAAFAWLVQQLRSAIACIVSALFWALPLYLPALSGPYTLMQPDYVALDVMFPILAAAAILRCSRDGQISVASAAFFGVMIGVAAATKISFILFPMVAFGYVMLRVKYAPLDFLLKVAIAASIGAAVWCSICFVDYGLATQFVARHLRTLMAYVRYGGGVLPTHDLPPLAWLTDRALNSPPWNAAVYLAPMLAILTVAICRTRDQLALALVLLIAALGWSAFLYKRDYPATLLEAAFAFHLFLYGAVAIIIWPNLSARWRIRPWVPSSAIASILGFVIVQSAHGQVASIVRSAANNTVEQAHLGKMQRALVGKRLWVVLDNSLRPLSIDSAIMKGGDVPGSPIMLAMFPDVDFRFMKDRPFDLSDYAAVLLPFNGSIDQMVGLVSEAYSVPLDQWRCRPIAIIQGQAIGLCQPNR
jgi:hypothetical protein